MLVALNNGQQRAKGDRQHDFWARKLLTDSVIYSSGEIYAFARVSLPAFKELISDELQETLYIIV